MKKNTLAVRIFFLLFIIVIFLWVIPSTASFITLDSSERAAELPQWLKDASPFSRVVVILIFVQFPYLLIAFSLFMEFLNPNICWKFNKNRFLTIIAAVLLIVGVFTLIWNGFIRGFSFNHPPYDTMIYGIGFGILFLLSINYYSIWIKILLWTRLIEVFGPLIGYNVIPAVFGKYTGGAFGHFGFGLKGMLSSLFFLTDFAVQIFSVIGVMYLLSKAGFRWFWIISFSIGAVIVGLTLTYIMPLYFK